MASLPIRRYEGEVHVVSTLRDADLALPDMLADRVVGLDTETRPAFVRGQSCPPCLVQVATSRAVYQFCLQEPAANCTCASNNSDCSTPKRPPERGHAYFPPKIPCSSRPRPPPSDSVFGWSAAGWRRAGVAALEAGVATVRGLSSPMTMNGAQ